MYSGQNNLPPPPNYVMLQNPYGAPQQPYYQPTPYNQRRGALAQYQTRRSGCGCCLRCICCIYILLFFLIFAMASALFIVYTFYQPKIPNYELEDFSVKAFSFQPDLTVKADFQVTIRAENPNTKIGFIYGSDNSVMVSYEGSMLCSGNMPAFQQGHQNITIIKIPLTGKTAVGSGIQSDLTSSDHQGHIPLLVQVKVPITVVLDTLPLREFIFNVYCRLIVDDLRPDKKPKIISTAYTFGFGL